MWANFQAKLKNLTFLAQICPKMGFWVPNFKKLSLDLKSPPPSSLSCQFSVKTDNFEFFGLNLGKLPNYMRYFGSNNVEGVAKGPLGLK